MTTPKDDYEPEPDLVEEMTEFLRTLINTPPTAPDLNTIWDKATHPQHPTVQ